MASRKIEIMDTTLRDGEQTSGVSFSVSEKLTIAKLLLEELKVDLPNQTVTLVATGESESFVINTYKKDNMLNGFDDIDYLKNIEDEISAFAETRPF
jgi:isopropylmalate/homocitrate/citramalate synthase